jgi:hypothetical protein
VAAAPIAAEQDQPEQQLAPKWQQEHEQHQQQAQPMNETNFAQAPPAGPGITFNDESF